MRTKEEMYDVLEVDLQSTNRIRTALIQKLHAGIEYFEEDISQLSPEDREAYMSSVNSLGRLLNNKDAANINVIKLHQAQEKNDIDSNNSEIVGEFLRGIKPGSSAHEYVPGVETQDMALVEAELEDGFDQSTISDAELEIAGKAVEVE